MKYDDLEKTQDLFDINEEIPLPIDNIEMEGINKEVVTDEFTLNLNEKKEKENQPQEPKKEPKKKKEKTKKSLKDKWHNLTKKQKILVISILILVLIIILTLVLFLVLKKDEKPVEPPKEPEKPVVIIEKDNYIYKDGTLVLIDKDDNELGSYECTNKDEKLCFVAFFNDEDTFNTSKNIYEDKTLIKRRVPIYENKYAFINDSETLDNNNIILYNIIDQKEEGKYTLVKGFSDSNIIVVKDSNKYGALEINNEGINELMSINFDYIGRINKDSKFLVNTNKKYFIYNTNGKLESKGFTNPVKNYNDKYVVIENNGEYLYDYQAKVVINESFDYIDLMNDYVSLVKDNYLYIRDYKNNKYNEDGIELFNDNYNIVNTYDKDNKLIKTDYAYKIEIINNNLEVTYLNRNDKERNVSIALNDGKVSMNYPNLNYFDGKLYIYKEEAKETLLGTYTCTNKNNTLDSKELNNCIIATENEGFIPIINERYVFVVDSLDTNNKTINLYDLSDNKVLSRYSSVNTGLNPTEAKVTFVNNNDLYITAINRNNKYGVIKVEDEVKGVIPFNYTNIEKLKDDYLAADNNNYILYDSTGKKIASSSSKIVDYNENYLIVLEDDHYYVANLNGEKITPGYLHIKLENGYYVVINTDKQLDIKKYDDKEFGLASPIPVETDDYANSYKVGKNSAGYVITITSTNKTIEVDDKGVEKGTSKEE